MLASCPILESYSLPLPCAFPATFYSHKRGFLLTVTRMIAISGRIALDGGWETCYCVHFPSGSVKGKMWAEDDTQEGSWEAFVLEYELQEPCDV